MEKSIPLRNDLKIILLSGPCKRCDNEVEINVNKRRELGRGQRLEEESWNDKDQ